MAIQHSSLIKRRISWLNWKGSELPMLDKHSTVPMYAQIESYLKARILTGGYRVGEAIPSERELTEQFGVSRMTVRQSITNLVTEGLLYREKGRGTFVTNEKVEQPLSKLTSFTEDMFSRGMTPSNKLLGFERIKPTKEIIKKLHLSKNQDVFEVTRIRYADDVPMAIERSFLPVHLMKELNEEALNESLYAFVEKDGTQVISHASQRMEAALVTSEDALLLQIELPSAIITIERISYLTNEQPFEIVHSTYRADRYKFTSEIRR